MTPVAPRHFAWQAWHLVTSTFASRGRRGTNSHLPSFCVAGVALMVLGGALGPGLGGRDARGAASLPRGRRGTILHPWSFCVADMTDSVSCMQTFIMSFLSLCFGRFGPTRSGSNTTRRATLSHTYTYIHSFIHTYIHTHVCTYRHTYVRTYIHIYIHTYVHAYHLFTYFHTQSFTTSFVFPSFSDPATTFETHYWKKLTCGVIRSFNFCGVIPI